MFSAHAAAAGFLVVVFASPALAQPDLLQLRNDRARLDSIGAAHKRVRDSIAASRLGCDCPSPATVAGNRVSTTIQFDADRSEITPDSRATLDRVLPFFRANPDRELRIVGGPQDAALGTRREHAARRYLIAGGIDARRIAFVRANASPASGATFEIIMTGENLRRP